MADQAEKVIIEIGLSNDEYIQKTKETIASLQKLKDEQKVAKTLGKENTVEYQQNAQKIRELNLELKAQTALTKTSNDSIQGLRSSLSLMTLAWSKLSQEERENSKEGQALSAKMKEVSDKLKEQEKGVGDTRRNVGNYAETIGEAVKAQIPFFSDIQDAVEKFKGLSGGISGSTTATKGFGMALKATGIGFIIQALVAVINYLRTFDPLMDKIEQQMAAFGARVDTVGRVIVHFFNDIKSLGDFISKMGNILKNPMQAFKDLGNSMEEAAEAAIKLKAAQQDLTDAQEIQEVVTARAQQRISQLMLQSQNRQLSPTARKRALAEALKLDQDDFNKRTKLVNDEINNAIDAAKLKGALSSSELERLRKNGTEYAKELLNKGKITDAEVDALKQAELNKISILKESTDRQEKIQKEKDMADQQLRTEAEKRAAKRQADEEKTAADLKQLQDDLTNAEFDRAQRSRNAKEQELAEVSRKYKDLEERAKGNKNELARINSLRIDEEKTINAKYEQIQKAETEKLEIQKMEIRLQLIKDDALKTFQLKLEILERQRNLELEQLNLTENEKSRIELEFQSQRIALQDELRAQEQAKKDEEFARELEIAQEKMELEQEMADERMRIEDQLTQSADNSFKNMETLFGKQTTAAKAAFLAQKALAIAKVKMNLEQEVSGIRASPMTNFLGIAGEVIKRIQIAAARISAGFSVANIIGTTIKGFNRGVIGFKSDGYGSMVTGPGTGTSDSINARLSDGESVINARSTALYGPLLSRINEAGGGRPLSKGGSHFALGGISDGGTAASYLTSGVNGQGDIVNAVVRGLESVRIVTSVEDVITGVNNKVSIKERVNI